MFRPNTRRVFATWARAVDVATRWASQTGRKYRVRRVGPVYRVERTARRAVIERHTVVLGRFDMSMARQPDGSVVATLRPARTGGAQ